jgi:membrane-associated phospholipid phosphatase
MYSGFALPIAVALIDGKQRNRFGQVLVLYTETMAVTGAMFSITAGAVNRARPLVYASHAPMEVRMSKNSQRSFYAGHTASVASATFFMAKVFNDFHPDSKLRPWIWALGAAVPAYIGYSRYKSGHHFLSDNIIGYVVGAASGILIPHWHKTSKLKKNMSIVPVIGQDYRGMSLAYKF